MVFYSGDEEEYTFAQYIFSNVRWRKMAHYTFSKLNVALKERFFYVEFRENF